MNSALPALYQELRELPASYLRKERPNHTLQPTALVHESYLRLVSQHAVDLGESAAVSLHRRTDERRILANHAIARKRNKRDSGEPLLELEAAVDFQNRTQLSIAKLEEALRGLEARFFGGLTMDETGEVLGISPVTVKRDWMTARQWLQREISSAN